MKNVLVVDDNPIDLRVAGACVEESQMHAVYASDGQEALDMLQQVHPAIVLTDLDMPNIDGLELVRRLRSRAPNVPVILMTAQGSEDIAAEALKLGASSYVPKRKLREELKQVLRIVAEAARNRDQQQNVYQSLVNQIMQFMIGNDEQASSSIVSHLQNAVVSMGLCEESRLLAVGTALLEAMSNAINRGNLELAHEEYERGPDAYATLRRERLAASPYRDRKVFVTAALTKSEAVFTIRDEGPGFDVSSVPDPDDAERLVRESGRGLLLIQMFMDEVSFNEQGNEITLRLYPDVAGDEAE